nr:FMN reductase [Arthrobacter sp. zg-Y919]
MQTHEEEDGVVDRRIVVVSGGLGVPSSSRMLADALAAAAKTEIEALGSTVSVTTFELREYAVDIANNMVTGYAAPRLEAAINELVAADALVAVTPVFTASMSGLFKSFFDVVDNSALDGKPVLLGATGGSARHSMVLDYSLRPMFSYLRARIAPTAVYAAPGDWGSGETGTGTLDQRVRRAAGELVALLGDAPVQKRSNPAESLPFEELLAQTQRN